MAAAVVVVLVLAVALGLVGLPLPGAARGTISLIDVQSTRDQFGFGLVTVTALFDVTGPTHDAVVMCRFSGNHWIAYPTSATYVGWVDYVLLPDLAPGEVTATGCEQASLTSVGNDAPSAPVISLISRSDVVDYPNTETVYVPATPWP